MTCIIFCSSCSKQASDLDETNQAKLLVGTWTLKATITKDKKSTVLDPQKRIIIKQDGTFELLVRSKDDQPWSKFGTGALYYSPPLLTLYWNSGAEEILTLTERKSNRFILHVGQSFAPTKELHPDEVYERTTPKSSSSKS